MTYHVEMAPEAVNEAEAVYLRLREESDSLAIGWFNGLVERILSLDAFPRRCPLALEAQELGREIRQVLYGRRESTYRILFEVRQGADAKTGVVRILHIRRGGLAWPPSR